MKSFLLATALFTTELLASGLALAAPPHQHGVALLDVAYEAGKLSIALDSPLDNLIGFERAPRTDAERKAADAAVATLKATDTLFRIDPAAQCTLSNVTLESAPLKLGAADKKSEEGHADLDGSFEFACKGSAPAFVEVGMFKAFPRLQRLEVQVATAKGQSKASLKRPAQRIELKH